MTPLQIRKKKNEICSGTIVSEFLPSVPTCNQAFGDRAFSVCAPQLWNKLPQAIKASDNVDLFKMRLKAHLFIEAFG